MRECEEETGYRPGRVRALLTYAHAEGYSTGFLTAYLGTDLAHTGNTGTDPARNSLNRWRWLSPAARPRSSGQIVDSKTILCALLAERTIESGRPDT